MEFKAFHFYFLVSLAVLSGFVAVIARTFLEGQADFVIFNFALCLMITISISAFGVGSAVFLVSLAHLQNYQSRADASMNRGGSVVPGLGRYWRNLYGVELQLT